MRLEEYNYNLPKNLIAQRPVFPRDHSKLMVLDRKTGAISHHFFYELDKIIDNSFVLVFNNTKVLPYKIFGKKKSGGKVDILFLQPLKDKIWEVLLRGRLKEGDKIYLKEGIWFRILNFKKGVFKIRINVKENALKEFLKRNGLAPLPPYIKNLPPDKAKRWYQTIFAKREGSIAAPTASFHFTKSLIRRLSKKGIEKAFITLHVNLGTFAPLKAQYFKEKKIHSEFIEIPKESADFLNRKIKEGKKILAVGSTVARALETVVDSNGFLKEFKGETTLFIYPPYRFKIVKALITNFHLPKTTLMCFVSAFGGKKNIKKAYSLAIIKKYRFFSFGDAMLIL